MSSEVKRFYATDYETEYPGGKRGKVLVVKAADYAALEAENARLRGEISDLHTTMMAAAVEIQQHWAAHCDEGGYGPANLMHRLENGIAAQYGYTAQTLVRIEAERDAALAQLAAIQQAKGEEVEPLCAELAACASAHRTHSPHTAHLLDRAAYAIDALRAELAAVKGQEAVAWRLRKEVDSCGLNRYMTQKKYSAQPTAIQTWYEPFRCASCDASPDVEGLVNALELWLADYDEVAANPDFEPHPHVAERVTKSRAALSTWRQGQGKP